MKNFTFQDWKNYNSFLKVWQPQGFTFQLASEKGKLPITIQLIGT